VKVISNFLDEWGVVILSCWAVKELLSGWEEDLLVKCSLSVVRDEGLTRAQMEKLHEIYIERFVEKIPSPDREEK
jgi:hypothetical protein